MNPDSLAISHGTVYTPRRTFSPGLVVIEKGKISYAGLLDESRIPAGAQVLEAREKWVCPGLVDVHIHGGAGGDSLRDGLAGMEKTARLLVKHGVTSFLPSTPSAPLEQLAQAVEQAKKATGKKLGGAEVLGLHLEGPYLSPEAKGAHDPAFLREPKIEECAKLLKIGQGAVKMLTLAPELEGAVEFTRWLSEQGVVVSLGHSAATYDQAKAAIDAGATHGTHVFNTMPDMKKREPGLVGALLEDDRVYAEFIADLVHVHPAVLKIALRAKTPQRSVLISDAIEAAGMPDGEYELSGLAIAVKKGIALLANSNTLAGSTLTLDKAVRNTVQTLGLTFPEALLMASETAADSLRLPHKGRLQPGADGDVVILNEDISVAATIVNGEVVFQGNSE